MRILCSAFLLLLAACRATHHDVAHLRPHAGDGPRILVVTAHPDDEIAFAGTLYKTSTFLNGRCDLLVVTNGEGGFKYATLAEPLYGLPLTEEEVGRAALPSIRRGELIAGGDLLGLHSITFLGQRDHRYTQDVTEVLGPDADVWDLAEVRTALRSVLAQGEYDFVLVHAPTAETHAHHKAASILALEAVGELPPARRPAALCVRSRTGDEPVPTFDALEGFPITRVLETDPLTFDRTQRFGYRDRLDYRIVANWAIAEHRSQGTMQLLVNRGDVEHYFLLDVSPPGSEERVRALFDALGEQQFHAPEYGDSAGTNTDGRARR